jgi:hypothetical protein
MKLCFTLNATIPLSEGSLAKIDKFGAWDVFMDMCGTVRRALLIRSFDVWIRGLHQKRYSPKHPVWAALAARTTHTASGYYPAQTSQECCLLTTCMVE